MIAGTRIFRACLYSWLRVSGIRVRQFDDLVYGEMGPLQLRSIKVVSLKTNLAFVPIFVHGGEDRCPIDGLGSV